MDSNDKLTVIDPNWPYALFQSFVDNEKATFRSS
jgi:hypothetical protein